MRFIPVTLICLAFVANVAAETPPSHPPVDHKAINEQAKQNKIPVAEMKNQGKVVSVISVNNYAYLEVTPAGGGENIWIALPDTIEVSEGDSIHYKDGPVMRDFTSRSLDRTFDSIIFLSDVSVD